MNKDFVIFPYDCTNRAAAQLVQKLNNTIIDDIYFIKNNKSVSGKSFIGVLSLGIIKDERIEILWSNSHYTSDFIKNIILNI